MCGIGELAGGVLGKEDPLYGFTPFAFALSGGGSEDRVRGMEEEGSSGTSQSPCAAPSGSKGRRAEGSQSPVVYREKPLDYVPTRLCYCKEKAPRWISWSDENPGRRYYTCKGARAGGCGFWQWHDPETPPFLNHLLLDLRDKVWGLKKENAELKMQMEETKMEVARRSVAEVKGRHAAEIAILKNKLEEKEMKMAELAVRVQKQNMIKLLFHAVVVSVVVLFVWAVGNQQL